MFQFIFAAYQRDLSDLSVCDGNHRVTDNLSAQGVALLHDRSDCVFPKVGILDPGNCVVKIRVKGFTLGLDFLNAHLCQDADHVVIGKLDAAQEFLVAASDRERPLQRIEDRQQVGETFDLGGQADLFLFLDGAFAVVVKLGDLAQQLILQRCDFLFKLLSRSRRSFTCRLRSGLGRILCLGGSLCFRCRSLFYDLFLLRGLFLFIIQIGDPSFLLSFHFRQTFDCRTFITVFIRSGYSVTRLPPWSCQRIRAGLERSSSSPSVKRRVTVSERYST